MTSSSVLLLVLALSVEASPGQAAKEPSDDLSLISRIVGTDVNRIASVVRYHSAILMTRTGQYEAAYEALQQFVFQQNTSPKVIEALGLSILRMPLLPSEYPPGKKDLVLLAGRAAYAMADRRAEEADRLFQELVSRHSAESNVHYAYGVFLLGGDPERALQYFHRELMTDPRNVPSLLQIALEYLRQGKHEDALPLAEKAHALAPDFSTCRKVLGRVFLETGETERAVEELEGGVELAPGDHEMHFALSRAYARAGRKEDAARARREFLRLDAIYRSRREGALAVGGLKLPKRLSPRP